MVAAQTLKVSKEDGPTMGYVVVVCPKCRLARGASEGARATRCTRCGRSMPLKKLRKRFRTGSLSELAEAVGRINAELRGGLELYLEELSRGRAKRPGGRSRPGAGAIDSPGPRCRGEGGDSPSALKSEERPSGGGVAKRAHRLEREVLETLSRAGASSAEEGSEGPGGRGSLEEVERVLERLRADGAVYMPTPGRYALVR